MSSGLSWAYEQQEIEFQNKIKQLFNNLTPEQCARVYSLLQEIREEPMTRQGHTSVDLIIQIIRSEG